MKDDAKIPALKIQDSRLIIEVGEQLGSEGIKAVWRQLSANLRQSGLKQIMLNAEKLKDLDTSGGAFIAYISKEATKRDVDFEIVGLSDSLQSKIEAFSFDVDEDKRISSLADFIENIGKSSVGVLRSAYDNIAFLGRLTHSFVNFIKKPGSLRWKDTLEIGELAGVNSFWICSTIGVLFGLILAFQSAMPMKQFGAEIYVASLVSMSLFRVLGPFIAAVLFSARSGSAFAAEIGTMKVNEEIDALVTMGLDPISFLALPRVICGFFAVPLLAIFVNLFGLVGMFGVMLSLGYPFSTIYEQTISFTTLTDMGGGIFKSFVFGFLVAAVGCLRGLQTTTGSQAVGQAATKAVVSGIVLVVVAEGIFSVIFYILGI